MKRFGGALLTLSTLLVCAVSARAVTLLDEKFPRRDRLETIGFELLKPGEIQIDAAGLAAEYSEDMLAYAWIIDHDTRKVVWEMKSEDTERAWGKKYLRKLSIQQVFSRGKYELYLYTGNSDGAIFYTSDDGSALKALGRMFSGSSRDPQEQLDDCYVRLESSDLAATDVKRFEPTGELPGALFAAAGLGNDEYIEQAFTLDKPEAIRVYSLIEAPSGSDKPVDFGWITNADSREIVWSAADARSVRGGGGKKNRKIDTEITLPAGNYILYYVTDDSHSYKRFNVAPPYDPMNWGMTLLPGKDFIPAAFHLSQTPVEPAPLLDMTRLGDDEDRAQEFKLDHNAKLHIRAIGEWGDASDEFADYGWIEDATTEKTVWEMTERNTDFAGGADKNRMFDGDITLPAGTYVAHFVTDDSHSYEDWNDSQPWMPRGWGLAIYPTKGFDRADFKLLGKDDQRSRWSKRRP
jgi:hypothetical protein